MNVGLAVPAICLAQVTSWTVMNTLVVAEDAKPDGALARHLAHDATHALIRAQRMGVLGSAATQPASGPCTSVMANFTCPAMALMELQVSWA
jgi:hypothetical protein